MTVDVPDWTSQVVPVSITGGGGNAPAVEPVQNWFGVNYVSTGPQNVQHIGPSDGAAHVLYYAQLIVAVPAISTTGVVQAVATLSNNSGTWPYILAVVYLDGVPATDQKPSQVVTQNWSNGIAIPVQPAGTAQLQASVSGALLSTGTLTSVTVEASFLFGWT